MKTIFLLASLMFCFFLSLGQSLIPWMNNGLHGFANKDKKVAIEPQYTLLMPFYEGFALVTTKTASFLIDSGNTKVSKEYKPFDDYGQMPDMIHGYYILKDIQLGKSVAVHPKFGQIGEFTCNYLKEISPEIVALDENYSGFWLWNKAGKKVLEEKVSFTEEMGEGLIPVTLSNGTAGFIDKDGKKLLPFTYQRTKSFSEGLAPVKVNGKYGFIDKKGIMKIPPAFDDAEPFSFGVAVVKSGSAYGYIDKAGKWILQPAFKSALPCINGFMCVRETDGLFGFYDKTGKRINELKAYNVWGFYDNRGLFSTAQSEHDPQGYVDPQGNVVIKPIYKQSSTFKNGIAKVRQRNSTGYNYTGFIDTAGNAVLPFEFSHINEFLFGDFILVSQDFGGKSYSYYADAKNNRYTSMKVTASKPNTTITVTKTGTPKTHCVTFILEKEQSGMGSRRMVNFFMFVQVNDKTGTASEARVVQEARKVFNGRNLQGYRERAVVVDNFDCMESKSQADKNPNLRIDQFLIEYITIN